VRKTGDSKAALARFGMTRGELQPGFAALAPQRAVTAICSETGAPEEVSRDLLGLFAVDGAAVVRYALDCVAADPSRRRPTSRLRSLPTALPGLHDLIDDE